MLRNKVKSTWWKIEWVQSRYILGTLEDIRKASCGFCKPFISTPLACNSILRSAILRLSRSFRQPGLFPSLPTRIRDVWEWLPWKMECVSKVYHYVIFAATSTTFIGSPYIFVCPFQILSRFITTKETKTISDLCVTISSNDRLG